MKKHLANAITCLNVLAGSLSIVCTFQGNYTWAAYCIVIAAVFDFLDGFVARMLHAVSAIGKELDSLCDIVSFGVAPSMMAFHYMQTQGGYWCYAALLMVAFSALRLAIFNLDERQTSSFIGLPTPANAIFWAFGIAGMTALGQIEAWIIALLCVVFSWLLVSPLPMFSLKFKNLHYKDNALRYIFLAGCIILIIWMKSFGFALSILWYILLCLLHLILKKS
ncbi:MAG: CDP-diacylglycerol--serine O-phosphatidyltransferase [Bacteroidales bacterium]|nr:CDP-diacylglycerol--serine O-phosphatidyltransferase [Bacteroidales bacterium]